MTSQEQESDNGVEYPYLWDWKLLSSDLQICSQEQDTDKREEDTGPWNWKILSDCRHVSFGHFMYVESRRIISFKWIPRYKTGTIFDYDTYFKAIEHELEKIVPIEIAKHIISFT